MIVSCHINTKVSQSGEEKMLSYERKVVACMYSPP
jgi:hypothetical protein